MLLYLFYIRKLFFEGTLRTVFKNRIGTNIKSNLGTKDLQWVWKEMVQGCEVRDRKKSTAPCKVHNMGLRYIITERVNFPNA